MYIYSVLRSILPSCLRWPIETPPLPSHFFNGGALKLTLAGATSPTMRPSSPKLIPVPPCNSSLAALRVNAFWGRCSREATSFSAEVMGSETMRFMRSGEAAGGVCVVGTSGMYVFGLLERSPSWHWRASTGRVGRSPLAAGGGGVPLLLLLALGGGGVPLLLLLALGGRRRAAAAPFGVGRRISTLFTV